MLPLLGGSECVCRDINSSNEVVGHAANAFGQYHAVVWNVDGDVEDLGTFGSSTQSFGLSINDAGVVVGTDTSNNTALLHDPVTGWRALPDFGFKAIAADINNSGWVLGWADEAPWETVPVVWDPQGNLHNIASLVSSTQFYFPGDYIVPIAISDTNLIAVRGYDFVAGGDPRVIIFRVTAVVPCTTDVNGDGVTDGLDLSSLMAGWGSTTSPEIDFNDDGFVDGADLAALVGAWGPC